MIVAASLPVGPTDALRCPEDVVTCDRTGGVRLPRFGVFALWYDCVSLAGGDRVMALAGVDGAIGGDSGDSWPGGIWSSSSGSIG